MKMKPLQRYCMMHWKINLKKPTEMRSLNFSANRF